MTDIVFIEDLTIETVIGIYDWERDVLQPVTLTLEMSNDNRRAAASGDVAETVDYNAVATRLTTFVAGGRFGLLETLAERCAEIVRHEFGVRWVRLTVRKPGALSRARAVGVEIVRGVRG